MANWRGVNSKVIASFSCLLSSEQHFVCVCDDRIWSLYLSLCPSCILYIQYPFPLLFHFSPHLECPNSLCSALLNLLLAWGGLHIDMCFLCHAWCHQMVPHKHWFAGLLQVVSSVAAKCFHSGVLLGDHRSILLGAMSWKILMTSPWLILGFFFFKDFVSLPLLKHLCSS